MYISLQREISVIIILRPHKNGPNGLVSMLNAIVIYIYERLIYWSAEEGGLNKTVIGGAKRGQRLFVFSKNIVTGAGGPENKKITQTSEEVYHVCTQSQCGIYFISFMLIVL